MKSLKTIICILTIIVSTSLYALDLGIGLATWYADWKMKRNDSTTNLNEEFYIGPSIAFQLSDKWSTTLVALTTLQKYEWITGEDSVELDRYDLDLALKYQISRYIKVFCGAKYLAFLYHNKTSGFDGIHHAVGPGAGISFTIPLLTNVYVLANLSGLYILGKQKEEKITGDISINFYEIGANASLQLAYYIPSVAVTLASGYRYQYVETLYTEKTQDFPNLEHTFKGIIFLLVKSFDI